MTGGAGGGAGTTAGAGGGGMIGAAGIAGGGGGGTGARAIPALSGGAAATGACAAPAGAVRPAFVDSMDATTASFTSSSVVPKMSGRVRASDKTFAAISSSLAIVLPLSFASIASFCVFHFGSMSEMRMCSAMLLTAMSSPVIGETANFVASAPCAAFAFASAASTSGFLWLRTIFIEGSGPGAAGAVSAAIGSPTAAAS